MKENKNPVAGLDLSSIPTPCYIINTDLLESNLQVLHSVKEKTGCKVLLALKAFSMYSTFPLIRDYLDGTCASSPDEARLGKEEFKKEVHVCAPAYSNADIQDLVTCSSHITLNSFSQWQKYKSSIPDTISCGIRINPEYSEVKTALYNPCSQYSRLGVTIGNFKGQDLSGISGLHFHTLCEQNADALENTLEAVEAKFGPYLSRVDWVNFGGGHHITRPGYDIDKLVSLINNFKQKYQVQVILEPGEAIALNTGVTVASVLDIIKNEKDIALLDTSAAAHMPDVLEMPYRPSIIGAGDPDQHPHSYLLGGSTCLAGDIIGEYSFPEPLTAGSRLVFCDMAHYTMVKNNTFNGVRLPSIALYSSESGKLDVARTFGYSDFRNRLS